MSVQETPHLSQPVRRARTASRALLWAASGVLLLGVAIRLFRFDAQPLWFDELYTAALVRDGLGAIWHNSFVQLTPPLPYLVFWLSAQIGGSTAAGLRAASLLAAVLTLPVFYHFCTRVSDRATALVATGLLAIAPLAIYYAQEARPYALALLALLLALLAYEQVRRRSSPGDWAIYALLAAIAGQLHYVNVILVGAQLGALLLLALLDRAAMGRTLRGAAAVVLIVGLALGPFMLGVHASGREWSGWRQPQATLQFLSTMQTMAAGDARFAPSWARTAALLALTTGAALALLRRQNWRVLLPHVLMLAFVIAVAFVLLPLAGVPAPAYEERPFLLVLPSALLLFSVGVRHLLARRRTLPWGVGLVAVLAVTSAAGLRGYFGGFVKSPEGILAQHIAAAARPGDIALGDAYSVDAALHLYAPALPVYSYRGELDGHSRFAENASPVMNREAETHLVDLEAILAAPRIWLLQRGQRVHPYHRTLLARYRVVHEAESPPFRVQLLEPR
jgi:mannosyltransferase